MLRLILGRAGSGKTSRIMEEIHASVAEGSSKSVFIVPEQYSHEAERELCRVCGNRASLFSEVLSFTRACYRVFSELGINPGGPLDSGGRVLAMAMAVKSVSQALGVFGGTIRRPEELGELVATTKELKSACISARQLMDTSQELEGALSDKLRDLSLVLASYDRVLEQSGADPGDFLTLLARHVTESSLAEGQVYVDGFLDFTRQELEVVEALLKNGTPLTICLTLDSLEAETEEFHSSRKTALRLINTAKKGGIPYKAEYMDAEESLKDPQLSFMEKNLFDFTSKPRDGLGDAVKLYAFPGYIQECEFAASRILELVRETSCRFRDIAIAVRGFDSYRPALANILEYYGVPVYMSRKSEIRQKPLFTLISFAFETILNGWEHEDIFAYLKTGLLDHDMESCDALENYVLKWSIRGGLWNSQEPWGLHPQGHGQPFDEKTKEQLAGLDDLRRQIAAPLKALEEKGRAAKTAGGQVEALAHFFSDIRLAEGLETRAWELARQGEKAQAAEYAQLWDVVVYAMEQCKLILGETPMDQQEFFRLFILTISQYDVGTIPISLDSVGAGDMDRMRRRHIRHLFVLGASEDRLPGEGGGLGVFSQDERDMLIEHGFELAGGGNDLYREFGLIYNCLSLPSDSITVTYPEAAPDGGRTGPSFVVSRLSRLFDAPVQKPDTRLSGLSALKPAIELAARAGGPGESAAAWAVKEYLKNEGGLKKLMDSLEQVARIDRGTLSRESVTQLYGERLHLSASRIDALSSCKFSYFMNYGLGAKERRKAGFEAPEMGVFVHYLLEGVTREVMALGGFGAVTPEMVLELADRFTSRYIKDVLRGFQGKTKRFIYLFTRLAKSVGKVATGLHEELSASRFTPLDFELRFARDGEMQALRMGDGQGEITVSGVVDRVDGWAQNGKLYLRVVDYKTGKKTFSLSEVCAGMGLQMLMYLFYLQARGRERYGADIVPAGVLYAPARDVLVSAEQNLSDRELERRRARQLRQSGLILGEDEVIEAMEAGEKRLLPIRYGKVDPEALASTEQFERLGRYIEQTILKLAGELGAGNISADPYYKGELDTACQWCPYPEACQFDERRDSRRLIPNRSAQKAWEEIEGDGFHERL